LQRLATDLGKGTLARYEALVLIAHSMGGLIVQKSLVDQKQIAGRTRTVILFGTPSGGLVKARTLKFWKRQLAGMAQAGEFITKLRADWTRRFAAVAPFSFLAIGGERDQFVPPKSSLEPFPLEQRAVVAGNHVTMIHPPPSDRNVVDLVVKRIVGKAAIGDSALRAIELGDFQTIIEEYLPHAGTLDSSALKRTVCVEGAVSPLRRGCSDSAAGQCRQAGRWRGTRPVAPRPHAWRTGRRSENAGRSHRLFSLHFLLHLPWRVRFLLCLPSQGRSR
jgi:hypothetical protein